MISLISSQTTGTAPVSIAGRMLESAPQEEQMVKDLAGIVYLAGSDTTVAGVTSFFLASLVYPNIQTCAQQELDRVVGRHRLPDFADKADLPYLDALLRECLRWLPALPTGAFILRV
jgi:cytochrome P450